MKIQKLVEAVPNISEGRDQSVISKLAAVIQSVPHVALLDVHVDADHHRSVFTIVGEPEEMSTALFKLVREAQQLIDLRQHHGAHPRIGAVDVVPWIPFKGETMKGCVAYARELGGRIGQELEIPVFLYEEAGNLRPARKLEVVRRGGLSALETRMKHDAEWHPDYGPAIIHPTAGAIAVGARFFLIAFNILLQTNDLVVAHNIAKTIRASSGGLTAVKAMAVPLMSQNLVQVSMNLTDYRETSLRLAFDAVNREAQRCDVEIQESEIVGLVPRAAWDKKLLQDLKLRLKTSDPVIESRLEHSSVFSGS